MPDNVQADRTAAVVGAQAVAEAVKKVADAAVDAVHKVSGRIPDMFVLGSPNGGFTILGSGFGASGTVKFGIHSAVTTGWGANRIEGKFPAGAPASGEAVVHVDDKTAHRISYKL